jgi:hypothetical protein
VRFAPGLFGASSIAQNAAGSPSEVHSRGSSTIDGGVRDVDAQAQLERDLRLGDIELAQRRVRLELV